MKFDSKFESVESFRGFASIDYLFFFFLLELDKFKEEISKSN